MEKIEPSLSELVFISYDGDFDEDTGAYHGAGNWQQQWSEVVKIAVTILQTLISVDFMHVMYTSSFILLLFLDLLTCWLEWETRI